jgi:hypothetical protein
MNWTNSAGETFTSGASHLGGDAGVGGNLDVTEDLAAGGNLYAAGTVAAALGVCLRTFSSASRPVLSVNEVAFWFAATGTYAGMGLLFYDGGIYWRFAASDGLNVTALVNP